MEVSPAEGVEETAPSVDEIEDDVFTIVDGDESFGVEDSGGSLPVGADRSYGSKHEHFTTQSREIERERQNLRGFQYHMPGAPFKYDKFNTGRPPGKVGIHEVGRKGRDMYEPDTNANLDVRGFDTTHSMVDYGNSGTDTNPYPVM